ncbi:MAG: HAMP domain-containing protein [Pseudomonadota bacterium]
MRIDKLSIKMVTIAIFMMVGIVAIILSLFAGAYFRQAAMDAQVGSLSRVIEVASQEILREVGKQTFDLGMKLGHNKPLIQALQGADGDAAHERLVTLLDDPFINGFVGFAKINLVKLRVYSPDLELVAESSAGMTGLENHLSGYMVARVTQRKKTERLKAIDALWLSARGPLYSTLVPVGGLRSVGYLEVVVDPAFNLPDIGYITKTPVNAFSMAGAHININEQDDTNSLLPVEFILLTSTAEPAFRIVGYEDVSQLSKTMEHTQMVTTGGFLLLTLITLLFALWLFSRFLFVPLGQMVEGMKQIAQGKLNLAVNKKGLREFSTLARSFESMANQVKIRTNDLERLLDLDDSAILCFGHEGEAVYFNKGATALFGYAGDEISELDLDDLFTDDIVQLMKGTVRSDNAVQSNALHIQLGCVHKDGHAFQSDAVINPLDVMGGFGYTIVLNPVADEKEVRLTNHVVNTIEQNEQRMRAVEQSLNSILEIAKNNPGMISGVGDLERPALPGLKTDDDKRLLRERVVQVMQSALACWERDLGKAKLDLAEESRIWPVYIDKSTPTTRTLDKYLHTDSCPKNPRNQRVIDTAEFVLRQMGRKNTLGRRQLQQALDDFRVLISGLKTARK